jgi:hypothetical protein
VHQLNPSLKTLDPKSQNGAKRREPVLTKP